VTDRARERGATVVAITASLSPLARRADLALIVDHVEDAAAQLPMIGRILYLLMVDILAVGVAMRRGADAMVEIDENKLGELASVAQRGSPGVSTAGRFANLTTHSRAIVG
jgi:glucokinase